jgi:hypothetical protein
VKINIIDLHFDETRPASIKIAFFSPYFQNKVNLSGELEKIFIRNHVDFEALHQLIMNQKIYECQMIREEWSEECNKITNAILEFRLPKELNRIKHNFNLTELDRLMMASKILNIDSFLIINLFSMESFNKKENLFLNRKSSSHLHRLHLKQTKFVEISVNISQYNDKSDKKKNFITLENMFGFGSSLNILRRYNDYEEYFIFKKSFEYLEYPFKSNCIQYKINKTSFNSLSHQHCIRQCIRFHCEVKLNCSCIILDSTINQLDIGYNESKMCQTETELFDEFRKKYLNYCYNLCPNDCFKNEFFITNRDKDVPDRRISTQDGMLRFSFIWDDSKPFLSYREKPVMTFTDYFCCIGGLLGMWFGISTHQIFDKYLSQKVIYIQKFINFLKLTFNFLMGTIIYIKAKFQSIIRYIYSYCQNKMLKIFK